MSRMLSKLEIGVTRQPMDLDYMEFTCRQELYLCNVLSRHIDVPTELLHGLQELLNVITQHTEWTNARNWQVDTLPGVTGRPRLEIEKGLRSFWLLTCL